MSLIDINSLKREIRREAGITPGGTSPKVVFDGTRMEPHVVHVQTRRGTFVREVHVGLSWVMARAHRELKKLSD